MVSQLGQTSRQLITAIDAVRDGQNVIFAFDGDLEYMKRLCKHLCWIRRVGWSATGWGGYTIGDGILDLRRVNIAEFAELRRKAQCRLIVDHRLAAQLKAAA